MSSIPQASASPLPRSLREPPLTLAEHLQAIEQLGSRRLRQASPTEPDLRPER
jgi:hypothetical protein